MISHRTRTRRARGLAALELSITLPVVILPLLVGLWEMGRMVEVQQVLTAAAREGGRQASTGALNNNQVRAVVLQYLERCAIPTTNAVVTVTNLTESGVDATSAEQLDRFRVTVSLPYQDVRWVSLGLVTDETTQLTGGSVWFSARDQDYPSPPVPPID